MDKRKVNEVLKYLKGVRDIKIPLIYKVLMAPIFGIFLCIVGFFLLYTPYSSLNVIIYGLLIIIFGICALIVLFIRFYAPEFVLELIKIKLLRKANECIIFFVDELGVMDTTVGEIDFSVREVKDKATGARFEFAPGDVVYYYRVPVVFVNGASGRVIPAKYANVIQNLRNLGFKTKSDVKRFMDMKNKRIAEILEKIGKLKRDLDVVDGETRKKIELEIKKLEEELTKERKEIEQIEDAINEIPWGTIKLQDITKVLGNENPEIKKAKAQRYYLAGYVRGMKDEGFIQILKWITLIVALIAAPTVTYIIVRAMGG